MADAFIIDACCTPRGIGKSVKRRWLIFTRNALLQQHLKLLHGGRNGPGCHH